MLLPGRRRRESASPFLAVVDPGSTSLRALVVGPGPDGPAVYGWAARTVRSGSPTSGGEAVRTFGEALAEAEAMAQMRADGWQPADQLVVGLPAWQLRGWASPVTQKRTSPARLIDERELESVLSRALHLSASRLRSAQDKEWMLLDAVPVVLGIDGKGVTDPVGFRGGELTASVFAAVARRGSVEAWKQLAERNDFSSLILTAAPLGLAACATGPQGILLDVGGEHTSVVWWRLGRPVLIGSADVGGRLLTECLVRQWRLSLERAETLQRSLATGQLAPDVREQVIDVLRPALRVWQHAVEGLLAEMHDSSGEPLPHRLLLCGGGSSVQEIMEGARALFLSQRLAFERYPELARLRPTDIPGIANLTEMGHGAGDVSALALAAWSARLAGSADRPLRIVQKLCR